MGSDSIHPSAQLRIRGCAVRLQQPFDHPYLGCRTAVTGCLDVGTHLLQDLGGEIGVPPGDLQPCPQQLGIDGEQPGLVAAGNRQRAGYINKEFDQYCLENIVHNPDELTKITRQDLVKNAGAQGTEFLMWMMMRGALGDDVTEITRNYHIPISNTASGTLLLECAA